jgi:hypothetical protein
MVMIPDVQAVIRCTVDGANPKARAIPRELQCVLATGRVSSVAVTTSATF